MKMTILLLAALLMPVAADAAETYSGRVLERDGLMYKPHSNVPLTATVERYHDNGQLAILYTLVDGKREGLVRVWHDNGQLEIEATSVDGKREGLVRMWHDNGQLQAEYTFVNDKAEGLKRFWHEDGQLKSASCYRAGKTTDMAYCKEQTK